MTRAAEILSRLADTDYRNASEELFAQHALTTMNDMTDVGLVIFLKCLLSVLAYRCDPDTDDPIPSLVDVLNAVRTSVETAAEMQQ